MFSRPKSARSETSIRSSRELKQSQEYRLPFADIKETLCRLWLTMTIEAAADSEGFDCRDQGLRNDLHCRLAVLRSASISFAKTGT